MSKYMLRLHPKANPVEIKLENLPKISFIDKEFIEVDDSGREIFLGILNDKFIEYMLIDNLQHCLTVYAKKKLPLVEKTIELCKSSVNDLRESNLSDFIDLQKEIGQKIKKPMNTASYTLCCANHCLGYFIYLLSEINISNFNRYTSTSALNYNKSMSLDSSARAAKSISNKKDPLFAEKNERMRQGEFIIDFLKAGKHLFLISK